MQWRTFKAFLFFCLAFSLVAWASSEPLATEPPPIPSPIDMPEEPATNSTQYHPEGFYLEFVKMLSMLGLVLVFLFFLMWFIKRMFNSRFEQMNATSLIKIVERRVITPKTTLYVLDIGQKRVVIAESHSGVTTLGDMPRDRSTFDEVMEKEKKE